MFFTWGKKRSYLILSMSDCGKQTCCGSIWLFKVPLSIYTLGTFLTVIIMKVENTKVMKVENTIWIHPPQKNIHREHVNNWYPKNRTYFCPRGVRIQTLRGDWHIRDWANQRKIVLQISCSWNTDGDSTNMNRKSANFLTKITPKCLSIPNDSVIFYTAFWREVSLTCRKGTFRSTNGTNHLHQKLWPEPIVINGGMGPFWPLQMADK